MDLFQVDDRGQLFISPAIEEWAPLAESGIDVVIDLEGGLDSCIPTHTNSCLYIYFPIRDDDDEEPPLVRLRAIARLGASLIAEGHKVLSHCGMGFNRSALVAGLILVELGMPGPVAVERLRERPPRGARQRQVRGRARRTHLRVAARLTDRHHHLSIMNPRRIGPTLFAKRP